MSAKKNTLPSDSFFVFYLHEGSLKYKGFKNQLEAEKFMNKHKREYMVFKGQMLELKNVQALGCTFTKIVL